MVEQGFTAHCLMMGLNCLFLHKTLGSHFLCVLVGASRHFWPSGLHFWPILGNHNCEEGGEGGSYSLPGLVLLGQPIPSSSFWVRIHGTITKQTNGG
ncbi:hypothetical protein Y032_0031g2285 [Ancylostoma ceylanicum]|uniref:Uncharacterized protein n=1 Tax=Ancylostoma ceylanicum TaxID=53326 RepID=A0A016UQM2_9BILA|nr:hypothetical protein Y032_0031g2285 [Ancylostoma ceylanicum]